MKQHINKDQLAELSLGGQKKLHSWFIKNQQAGEVYKLFHPTDLDNEKPSVSMMCTDIENCPTIILNENYDPELEYPQHENWECLPLLSIGQMIEFLEYNGKLGQILHLLTWTGATAAWRVINEKGIPSEIEGRPDFKEICDALWEAVVAELENQTEKE